MSLILVKNTKFWLPIPPVLPPHLVQRMGYLPAETLSSTSIIKSLKQKVEGLWISSRANHAGYFHGVIFKSVNDDVFFLVNKAPEAPFL